jgi:hypothetical protein
MCPTVERAKKRKKRVAIVVRAKKSASLLFRSAEKMMRSFSRG